MSFRVWPPGIQFFTNDGRVLAGGSLRFYDSGTTDPAETWSDPELNTPNPNPVPLDGAGRPNNDIWGDGSYRVMLMDSQGAVIVTRDNVSGPQGIPDPSLQSGEFLTNDGTDIFWAPIRQVPNPTGQPDGNVLTTDGAGNIAWEAPPNTRQVPDPTGITDGWVLTRDDASPGDYAWKAPASGIEAQDLISNGYVRLTGGPIIQWGTTGPVGALGTLTVSFPLVFPNACFSVVMTALNTGGTSQSADFVTNATLNNFVANNRGSVSRNFNYLAIGY